MVKTEKTKQKIKLVDGKARKERYREYLKSKDWRTKRDEAIKLTPFCTMCSSEKELVAHHRKYPDVFGEEPIDWLTVVCQRCHAIHHGKKYKKPKKKKGKRAREKDKVLSSQKRSRGSVKRYTKEEIAAYAREHGLTEYYRPVI